MKILKYGMVLLLSVTLWGCGKGNPAAPVTVESAGKHHPANWALPANHGANVGLGAKASASTGGGMNNCRACHGEDFSGGISKVSCFNNAACHGANVFSAHAKKPWWISNATGGVGTHTSTNPGNADACFVCHAGGNNSTMKPGTPVAGAKPGCFNNTLCHAEGAHSVPFPGSSHNLSSAFPATPVMVGGLATFPSCSCHDATTPGGTFAVGVKPLCSACHKALDATDPTKLHLNTNPGCGDCHGDKALNSARPVGAAFPDRKFAHDKHIFAGVGCSVCHNTYGTGSASHGYSTNNPNPVVANVAIAPEYKAETPAAAPVGVVNGYNPATRMCSNVSCHGGKAPQNINNQTPDWRAGAAGLLTDCFNCHDKATNPIPAIGTAYAPTTITPQYNSFWSGDGRVQGHTFGNSLHALHLGMGNGAELDFRNFGLISCTDCHDSTELAKVHFGGLNTTQMVGAETTILPTMNYNAGNSWGCAAAAGCHTIPSVFRWK